MAQAGRKPANLHCSAVVSAAAWSIAPKHEQNPNGFKAEWGNAAGGLNPLSSAPASSLTPNHVQGCWNVTGTRSWGNSGSPGGAHTPTPSLAGPLQTG